MPLLIRLRPSYPTIASNTGGGNVKEFHGINDEDIVIQEDDVWIENEMCATKVSDGDVVSIATEKDKEGNGSSTAIRFELYGPWMIVDSRKHRPRKLNGSIVPNIIDKGRVQPKHVDPPVDGSLDQQNAHDNTVCDDDGITRCLIDEIRAPTQVDMEV
ncbi:hypothetical protein V6N11_001399 [Hibiscus sabdariffa]|uniref:Uncharacterized protein n=1 Tax=Hibiscus sabdariffa TaxID=183260 RepID=A0ABR2RZM1_9ROSI